MLDVARVTDPQAWDELVNRFHGHPTQLWGWGEVKAAGAWLPQRLVVRDEHGAPLGCVQVLLRPLPGRLAWLGYAPRGPQTQPGSELDVLTAATRFLKKHARLVSLTIEPDWEVDSPAGQTFVADAEAAGWRPSENTVFIPSTLLLDLTRPAEELLGDMKKRGRYYIRKGEGAGFEIREITTPEEVGEVVAMYHGTAEAGNFGIHADDYYVTMPALMGRACRIWGAYRDGSLHAFTWLAVSETTAFELYGGSDATGQAENANPALKWAVIQQCQAEGVRRYDLNGLLNDGISTFKRQFAKHENMLVGTWDLPMSPLYPVVVKALPVAKRLIQRRHRP